MVRHPWFRPAWALSVLALLGFALAPTAVGAEDFYNPAIRAQWQAGEALAPNFWGPVATSRVQVEPYAESKGGQRVVQYFDKGRMEITNSTTNAVTNGLLASELIKGQIQVGDAAFQMQAPPAIPIAGDASNVGPTYAMVQQHAGQLLVPVSTQLTSPTQGSRVTIMFAQTGEIKAFPDGNNYPASEISMYDEVTQHNVPRAFASYRQRVGITTVGLAIAEPFWTDVKVGGLSKLVLVQVFERRVLTYTPINDPNFQVEMGNIGQHYARWRYGGS